MQNRTFLKAKPIYAKGLKEQMNVSLFFVYEGFIKDDSLLKITGNSVYRIYDNGVLLGYGPARCAHDYFRIDEFNLTGGKLHRLVIELSGYCCNSYYFLNTTPFLQAEIVADNQVFAYTSLAGDFVCYQNITRFQKVVRYSFQRTFSESYCFEKNLCDFFISGEKFSDWKSLEIEELKLNISYLSRNVHQPKYEALEFQKTETGVFQLDNSKKSYDDRYMHLDFLKIFDMADWEVDPNAFISKLSYQKQEIDNLETNCFETYELPVSKTGFVKFSLEALEDSEVYFVFDEIDCKEEKEVIDLRFYRNTTHNIVSYTLKKGVYEHMFFEPYTVKYLRVIVKKGKIAFKSLSFVLYENPDTERFTFTCADEKIERIVKAGVSTFAQNAVDILTDCPSRERAGWLYDALFTGMAEASITGENLVERNFLENYALSKQFENLPDGMIPMCYPSEATDGVFIPNWSLFYIIEIYQYFLRTRDDEILKLSTPKILGILNYFQNFENEYELLEDLESWIMVEWSKANDADHVCGVNIPTNMLYASAIKAAGILFDDPELLEKYERLKEKINQLAYNGTFYVDNLIRDEFSQLIQTDNLTETCQYYAFYFDIADREDKRELFDMLVEQFGPERDKKSVYPNVEGSNVIPGYFMRLFILLESGLQAQCYKEIQSYFYEMSSITGTLWEHNSSFASLNHGLCSSVVTLILRLLFGFIGVDLNKKQIIISKNNALKTEAKLVLKLNDNQVISFKNNAGKVKIDVPKGYLVKSKK